MTMDDDDGVWVSVASQEGETEQRGYLWGVPVDPPGWGGSLMMGSYRWTIIQRNMKGDPHLV